jgi:Immunity protein 74
MQHVLRWPAERADELPNPTLTSERTGHVRDAEEIPDRKATRAFPVQVLGRGQFLYREGGREMKIESELLSGATFLVVYSKFIRRWEPPHENEAIDDGTRERIIRNIMNAFASQDLLIRVEPPPWWPTSPAS